MHESVEEQQTNQPSVTEHDWQTPSGHRMHYRKVGSGPPLLLIHGLMGYSFSWRFTLPALAPHYTCYAVDLLGMGDSERPVGLDVSPRAIAETIIAFMESNSRGPWNVIGSSHGGGVAIWVARLADHHDIALKRLVLVSPINPWSAHGRTLAPMAAQPITTFLAGWFRWAYVPIRRWSFAKMYGDPHLVTKQTLDGYSRPLRIKGTIPHCLALLKDWNKNVDELENVMKEISVPTLIVWGTKDRLVYLSSASRVAASLPNAQLVTIEGAGHLPYEENPKAFASAVIPFLTRAN